jgi:hypothetical protein
MSIALPAKVYLDTNHLIQIVSARKCGSPSPHATIDSYFRKGLVGLIFNPAAPLEWVDGNATIESANEIAAVVDSAPLQYELEKDSFVFLHEIQAELRRLQPGIRLPDFEFLLLRDTTKAVPRLLPILKNLVPTFFNDGELAHPDDRLPNDLPTYTAAEHVEGAFRLKTERPAVYRERVDGHKAAYQHDVRALAPSPGKTLGQLDPVGWMKRFVRIDRVVAALNPNVQVDELLAQVDIARCPAVNLFLKAHMHRVRAANAVKDNDVDDWMFVPVVPYADLVLTERNLAHFLCQADPSLKSKVTHDPKRAIEMLRRWVGNSA